MTYNDVSTNFATHITSKSAASKLNSARDDILDPLKLPSLLLSIGITGEEYEAAAREEYILKKTSEIAVAKQEVMCTQIYHVFKISFLHISRCLFHKSGGRH